MDTPILDLQLAQEIELAEAQAAVGCVETMKKLAPEASSAFQRIAGGYAVYCGANNPLTQAVALGLDGPVSAADFDRLEAFYFSRQEPVRVETCPLAHPTLFEHYQERGYHVSEFSNVMVRVVCRELSSSVSAPSGLDIRRISEDEMDMWVLTVAQGFAENYPVTKELLRVMKMFALGKNTECYLASIAGQIAGGAALALGGRIAGLFGASTLPEFRRRGVQTGLLSTRLRRAYEAGCGLVMSLAKPGSASGRNISRLGLQTLYTRAKFERAAPSLIDADR